MQTMTVSTLSALLASGDSHDVVMIDVRTPQEYEHEHISGAINVPLSSWSTFDFSAYHDKTLIFYCRSGQRTQLHQSQLDTVVCTAKSIMAGGITAWKAAGEKVVHSAAKAPIDIMRQVQCVVGFLIILGVLLSVLSPYFLLLPLVVGVGLLFAGLTGFCGMARVLQWMPWNKTL